MRTPPGSCGPHCGETVINGQTWEQHCLCAQCHDQQDKGK